MESFEVKNIFTIKNFLIYLAAINIIGFLIMFIDKKRAIKNKWRIPEKTLFIITAIRRRNRNYFWNVCI